MSRFKNPKGLPYYCVIGQPIAHSLSPSIHQSFAKNLNIDLHYDRVEVSPAELEKQLLAFAAMGGRGMNVTVPLKEAVIALASALQPRAKMAGAANTLIFASDGSYVADNTDGVGLVRDLTHNLKVSLSGKRILVLGAGGAVRGIMAPLLEQSPRSITIANRTLTRAEELVKRFASYAALYNVIVGAVAYPDIPRSAFDLIINGTSLGLTGKLPPIRQETIGKNTFVYDMVYSKSGSTDFTRWSLQQGAMSAADGLGMLVEQAAEAFNLWHGIRPDTAPVLRVMRATA